MLGTLAALVLYWPPVRGRLNRLADLAGGVPDRLLQGILHPQDSRL